MADGRVCSIDTLELKLLCRPTLALQKYQKRKPKEKKIEKIKNQNQPTTPKCIQKTKKKKSIK